MDNLKNTGALAQAGKLLSPMVQKETGYILLTGEPGSGKATVMAKLFLKLQEQYRKVTQ